MNYNYKHEYLTVDIPIDYLEDAPSLLSTKLNNWWDTSYLSDLNPDENIPFVIEQWQTKYINTEITKEAIQKIRDTNPPNEITVKLVIDLLTDNFLKLDDEIDTVPTFRPYITTPLSDIEFSLDTYIYNPTTHKFESLEIVDQETLSDEGLSSTIINDFYSFHQRLLQATSKKLKLWTAQPEERIDKWNRQGFIDKNSYFTDSYQRTEYYFNPEEHDIIVFYRIPENQLIMTSDIFGTKEYVTLNDIRIE